MEREVQEEVAEQEELAQELESLALRQALWLLGALLLLALARWLDLQLLPDLIQMIFVRSPSPVVQ